MATILSRWIWVDVPRMIPAFSLCIGQWDPNFCVYWLMRNHSLCLYIDQWETTSCVCLIWGCPFICVVCSKWLLMNGELVWQLLIHSGSFSWTEALEVYQGLISLLPLPVDKNGHHFADIFKYIFMNKKFCILIQISLKFVLKGPINNNPALIRLMAWRRIGVNIGAICTNADPNHWSICSTRGRCYIWYDSAHSRTITQTPISSSWCLPLGAL